MVPVFPSCIPPLRIQPAERMGCISYGQPISYGKPVGGCRGWKSHSGGPLNLRRQLSIVGKDRGVLLHADVIARISATLEMRAGVQCGAVPRSSVGSKFTTSVSKRAF